MTKTNYDQLENFKRIEKTIEKSSVNPTAAFDHKAWFPLSQLRPRQRPISRQNKAISVKDDCSTL